MNWLWLLLDAMPTSDSAVHVSMGSMIAVLTAMRGLDMYQRRNERKNGNGNGGVKRCGTEELIYWERMRTNVTEPICRAINEQDTCHNFKRGAGA